MCAYTGSKVFGENLGRYLSHLGIKFAALRIGWTVRRIIQPSMEETI